MEIFSFALGALETNCFVIVNNNKAAVFDPGGDPTPVLNHLKKTGVELTAIYNTHLHFDHIMGNKELSEQCGVKIYASEIDAPLMETELGKGGFMGMPMVPEFEYNNIDAGSTKIADANCTIFNTPGHTPGSLTFYFEDLKAAIVGDLIFKRSIGRTDFPLGNTEDLLTSVKTHIFTLPDDTVLYSGHGPATTVGEEKIHNPYFSGL